MRVLLLLLIIVVAAITVGVASGFLSIHSRGGQVPVVATTGNGVVAKGGQPAAFDVETGTVKVGSKQANVTVPTVTVVPPANKASSNTAK